MSLQVNIIDCSYLYNINWVTSRGSKGLQLQFGRLKTELEKVRKELGYPQTEDNYLYSSMILERSHGFMHRNTDLGFKVVLQDREYSTPCDVDLRGGTNLQFGDMSRFMAADLRELEVTADFKDYDDVGIVVLSGSFTAYEAILAQSDDLCKRTTFATFEAFADKKLFRVGELNTKYTHKGIRYVDLSPRSKAIFGRELGEGPINKHRPHV